MAGDGNFKWYFGYGPEPETYYGRCDTRDEVIAKARAEVEPAESFSIVEADKAVIDFDFFRADNVKEAFEEHNCECWGEDGPELDEPDGADRDLELSLGKAFEDWLKRHGIAPRVWGFGEVRNSEYFPAPDKVDPE